MAYNARELSSFRIGKLLARLIVAVKIEEGPPRGPQPSLHAHDFRLSWASCQLVQLNAPSHLPIWLRAISLVLDQTFQSIWQGSSVLPESALAMPHSLWRAV